MAAASITDNCALSDVKDHNNQLTDDCSDGSGTLSPSRDLQHSASSDRSSPLFTKHGHHQPHKSAEGSGALPTRLVHSDSSASDPLPLTKQLRFDTVDVHDHPITLGCNPGGTDGPPVEIGWKAMRSMSVPIDEYEKKRMPFRRTSLLFLRKDRDERVALLKDSGFDSEEIRLAEEEAEAIRFSRETSEWEASKTHSSLSSSMLQSSPPVPEILKPLDMESSMLESRVKVGLKELRGRIQQTYAKAVAASTTKDANPKVSKWRECFRGRDDEDRMTEKSFASISTTTVHAAESAGLVWSAPNSKNS